MPKYKITKIKDLKFEGIHPNGIDTGYTKIGWSEKPPTVGERFTLSNIHDWFSTSNVTKVTEYTFETSNSVYMYELIDKGPMRIQIKTNTVQPNNLFML